ncbi:MULTISPECIES: hypothetical protein [Rhizobium]|uniref:GAF domain-containing protein n=3 Tax=Rhizobium TaxID=379 RepID=A0A6P1CCE1_RHITR|nr:MULTISPECIES: hypothetical protein [Rhizobium]AGB73619.1 hypothetical protein RTCIAT899_PB01820 [Rhizobium tropici CIAT 899]MBB4245202.1 hypothetical protein [Rhizobium tropici]MBB5596608.1 hypothetical protein [Rhizobium tropici]MBB6489336.1 hypothetical protein [Rhizobium lusitanum]MBB6495567.1 hypothetical protein [Rhizobium tropici]
MGYHLRDDQYQRLVVFHERAGRLSDSEALMALADNAFQEEFGHKLFTLLKVDRAAGVMRRIYSTDLNYSPLGGTKPLADDEWSRRVGAGRHFLGKDCEDMKRYFADHETLIKMGLVGVLNTAVVWRNEVIGWINLLDAAEHYTLEMCDLAGLYAQALAPSFLAN